MRVSGRGTLIVVLVFLQATSAVAETKSPGSKTDVVPAEQSTAEETPTAEDQLAASQASPMDAAQNLVANQSDKGPLREFRIFPAPFFTPETSLGVAVVTAYFYRFTDYPKARVSSNTSLLGATFNQQFSVTNRGDVYFGDNDWYLHYFVQGRLWPNAFFGIGSDVGTKAESYDQRTLVTSVKLQRKVLNHLYVGPALGVQYHQPRDFQENGQLIQGGIPGSDSHLIGYLNAAISWDSRNSSTFPVEGALHELNFGWNQDLRGGPYSSLRAGADLKQYLSITDDHVFALRLNVAFGFEQAGQLPFTMMPTIGGETKLRGIIDPRFRDRSAVYSVAEYRLRLSNRFGAVLFAGLGQVAPSLLHLQWDKFQPSAGAGVRYAVVPEERVNIRLDIATSATGSFETYIAAGEAF